tara:strand:+ start:194 stop:442 length:249 start_codon:yes stop_codon:yes gene_type:complete
VKAYEGTFIKTNGKERHMRFVKLKDLSDSFIDDNISGTGTTKTYKPGSELVWDIDEENWRIFNYKTITDLIKSFELDETDYM